MNRSNGIIVILVGVGLLFISFFFSSGSHPKRDFIGNISRMEIVLDGLYSTGHYEERIKTLQERWDEAFPWYEERIAIPLKYPLSLSVVLILVGTGIVLISKDKKTDA